jgi:hypothetical protein
VRYASASIATTSVPSGRDRGAAVHGPFGRRDPRTRVEPVDGARERRSRQGSLDRQVGPDVVPRARLASSLDRGVGGHREDRHTHRHQHRCGRTARHDGACDQSAQADEEHQAPPPIGDSTAGARQRSDETHPDQCPAHDDEPGRHGRHDVELGDAVTGDRAAAAGGEHGRDGRDQHGELGDDSTSGAITASRSRGAGHHDRRRRRQREHRHDQDGRSRRGRLDRQRRDRRSDDGSRDHQHDSRADRIDDEVPTGRPARDHDRRRAVLSRGHQHGERDEDRGGDDGEPERNRREQHQDHLALRGVLTDQTGETRLELRRSGLGVRQLDGDLRGRPDVDEVRVDEESPRVGEVDPRHGGQQLCVLIGEDEPRRRDAAEVGVLGDPRTVEAVVGVPVLPGQVRQLDDADDLEDHPEIGEADEMPSRFGEIGGEGHPIPDTDADVGSRLRGDRGLDHGDLDQLAVDVVGRDERRDRVGLRRTVRSRQLFDRFVHLREIARDESGLPLDSLVEPESERRGERTPRPLRVRRHVERRRVHDVPTVGDDGEDRVRNQLLEESGPTFVDVGCRIDVGAHPRIEPQTDVAPLGLGFGDRVANVARRRVLEDARHRGERRRGDEHRHPHRHHEHPLRTKASTPEREADPAGSSDRHCAPARN